MKIIEIMSGAFSEPLLCNRVYIDTIFQKVRYFLNFLYFAMKTAINLVVFATHQTRWPLSTEIAFVV